MDIIALKGYGLLPSVLDDEPLICHSTCKFVTVRTNLHKAHAEMCRVTVDRYAWNDMDMSNVFKRNDVQQQQVPSSGEMFSA